MFRVGPPSLATVRVDMLVKEIIAFRLATKPITTEVNCLHQALTLKFRLLSIRFTSVSLDDERYQDFSPTIAGIFETDDFYTATTSYDLLRSSSLEYFVPLPVSSSANPLSVN